MQRWEYRTIHRTRQMQYEATEDWVSCGPWTPADIDDELNKLGAEGWELVSVSPRSNHGSNGAYTSAGRGRYPIVSGLTNSELFVFKRPVG